MKKMLRRVRVLSRKYRRELRLVSAVLVFTVILQQLLPANKPIPFARVEGKFIRIANEQRLIDEFKNSIPETIDIQVNDSSYRYTIEDLDIKIDEQASVQGLYPKSTFIRLIPFSSIWNAFSNHTSVLRTDSKNLLFTMQVIQGAVEKPPVNSQLTVPGDTIKAEGAAPGTSIDPEVSAKTVISAIENKQSSVKLAPTPTNPTVDDQELQAAVDEYIAKIPETFIVSIEKTEQQLSKATITSWLTYETAVDKPVIIVDWDKLTAYTTELANSYKGQNSPTPTLVYIADGKETRRVPGKSGRGINAVDLAAQIQEALASAQGTVSASIVELPSPTQVNRSYSKTQEGLQQLINELAANENIYIYYTDLHSRGWTAGVRQDELAYMASTYKTFVAYSVLKRIDEGSMTMSQTVNGLTADSCLRIMIVNSDNDCAHAFAKIIGWDVIENEGKALGATGLNWSKDLSGTARASNVIPEKLARGEILSTQSRDYLLGLMKQQVYRDGVPAGTPHQVADKVGFFEGWLNDSAIVYAGNRPYALTVYTYNESWQKIADITGAIESIVL